VIDVRHISRHFGKLVALKDVNFSVQPGEILGLVGPNGAGKTTLLEIVSGLRPAESGRVLYRDTPLLPAERKRAMFYVPEATTPYPAEPVGSVLGLFARLFTSEQERLVSIISALRLDPVMETQVISPKGTGVGFSSRLGCSRRSRCSSWMSPSTALISDKLAT
jgi:ABC-type multidrug transport system ATPase subunit